jgi:predicted dehydrogenase
MDRALCKVSWLEGDWYYVAFVFCIVIGFMDTSRYFWNESADQLSGHSGRADGPFEPVRLGFVGVGLMGGATLERMLELPAIVTAICDVDSERLAKAAAVVAEKQPDHAPELYDDFRELCASPDVEAVVISTPDHWHVDIAVRAMEHGKDIYVEKPLSLTIAGGRRLADASASTGCIVQTGSQQRSSPEFQRAVYLIQNGALGPLSSVLVTLPQNNIEPPKDISPQPVPSTFAHNRWLGPAPWREYNRQLCHYNFRFISDYSGGQMTNWGAHHLDIVQWALGMDSSGPISVEGSGEFHAKGPFDTATAVDLTYRYPGDLPVYCRTTAERTGVKFTGTKGTLSVGRGLLEAEPASLLDRPDRSDDVSIQTSSNHYLDFLESVRTRNAPVAPAEAGHRSATVCHLGNIAIALGRLLTWDPQREIFPDDPEATALCSRPRRDWEKADGAE